MNRLLAYNPELEFMDSGEADESGAQELEFGADLLEVGSEAELDAFLRRLIASISQRGHAAAGSRLADALVQTLKRAARPILPIRSGTLATASPDAPDLKQRAARIFGLELEGLSPEDKEFEVAQRYVRLAADTVRKAGTGPASGSARPVDVAQAALAQAARQHAPGLMRHGDGLAPLSGRWIRAGSRIVLLDC
jgi:hypothetical protein